MLNMSWGEMAVIAVVTLIVVGPKELPNVLRTGAHWMRQIRKLSREFQSGVDSLVREAELDEAKKIVTSARQGTLKRQIENTIDPTGEMQKSLDPKQIAREADAATATRPAVAAAKPATPAAAAMTAAATETPATTEAPATGDASPAAPSNVPAKPKAVVIGPVDRPAKPAADEAAAPAKQQTAAAPAAVAQADPARKTGS